MRRTANAIARRLWLYNNHVQPGANLTKCWNDVERCAVHVLRLDSAQLGFLSPSNISKSKYSSVPFPVARHIWQQPPGVAVMGWARYRIRYGTVWSSDDVNGSGSELSLLMYYHRPHRVTTLQIFWNSKYITKRGIRPILWEYFWMKSLKFNAVKLKNSFG